MERLIRDNLASPVVFGITKSAEICNLGITRNIFAYEAIALSYASLNFSYATTHEEHYRHTQKKTAIN